MVHFPGLARARLWIQHAVTRFYQVGFPRSDIPGSKPACGSPRLFAACHVLLRLLAPRHPPYALSSLTIKLTQRFFLSEDPENFVTKSLASSLYSCSRRNADALTALTAKDTLALRVWQVRLSTLRYFEQNLRLCIVRTLTFAQRMPASFGCQRPSAPLTARNVSAPGGARLRFGAESAE
jgi:hypothetical protein